MAAVDIVFAYIEVYLVVAAVAAAVYCRPEDLAPWVVVVEPRAVSGSPVFEIVRSFVVEGKGLQASSGRPSFQHDLEHLMKRHSVVVLAFLSSVVRMFVVECEDLCDTEAAAAVQETLVHPMVVAQSQN